MKLKDLITEKKKDNEIYVQGVGKYSYDTLKKNVERKVKDLSSRNKKGNHSSIGKSQLDVLTRMWLALKEYEENQE